MLQNYNMEGVENKKAIPPLSPTGEKGEKMRGIKKKEAPVQRLLSMDSISSV